MHKICKSNRNPNKFTPNQLFATERSAEMEGDASVFQIPFTLMRFIALARSLRCVPFASDRYFPMIFHRLTFGSHLQCSVGCHLASFIQKPPLTDLGNAIDSGGKMPFPNRKHNQNQSHVPFRPMNGHGPWRGGVVLNFCCIIPRELTEGADPKWGWF